MSLNGRLGSASGPIRRYLTPWPLVRTYAAGSVRPFPSQICAFCCAGERPGGPGSARVPRATSVTRPPDPMVSQMMAAGANIWRLSGGLPSHARRPQMVDLGVLPGRSDGLSHHGRRCIPTPQAHLRAPERARKCPDPASYLGDPSVPCTQDTCAAFRVLPW